MSRTPITILRDIVPLRPLLRHEHFRLAELQAQRFLKLAGIDEPAVPMRIITDIPKIRVSVMRPFPSSGASHWRDGLWMVILNGREPETRRRFSLAHEFKHILDDRFRDLIYAQIPPHDRDDFKEQVCDYFAGCLLVPRPWLKRTWGRGIQNTKDLARIFDVSEAAIETRLGQIGLTEPRPRCDRAIIDWNTTRSGDVRITRYERALHPDFAIGAAA
jgi:Zn-dependent peptidase ImmA (M78 family)